jgi:hypothetical protein
VLAFRLILSDDRIKGEGGNKKFQLIMNTLRISNQVPFSQSIYCWLALSPAGLPPLVQASHQYDFHYLAWQTVRKERNPYFVNGTGFEGYFVGTCTTSDEALARILAIGESMLKSIAVRNRYQYRFRSKLMKTLVGEQCDIGTLYEWNALFGAALARLRCQAMQEHRAVAFREETYRLVGQQPEIHYLKRTGVLEQEYYVAHDPSVGDHRLLVTSGGLTAQDQDAWLVAQSVGRFGHPLVRTCLRRDIQDHGLRAA